MIIVTVSSHFTLRSLQILYRVFFHFISFLPVSLFHSSAHSTLVYTSVEVTRYALPGCGWARCIYVMHVVTFLVTTNLFVTSRFRPYPRASTCMYAPSSWADLCTFYGDVMNENRQSQPRICPFFCFFFFVFKYPRES